MKARRPTRLSFHVRKEHGYTILRAYDAHGEELGYFELQPVQYGRQKLMKVAFAEVTRPGEGIGTKMYEQAARIACRARRPLASDKTRTKYSNGFWEKQASKGRATCAVRSGGVKLAPGTFEPKGRWSCGTFALSCPAPRSLAGVR
jgi:hypothetical protein